MELPKDILLELVLGADPHALVSLSSSSNELNNFLKDPFVLQQLGILYDVPTPRHVSEIEIYLDVRAWVEDSYAKFVEAIERKDNDLVIKKVKIITSLLNHRIEEAKSTGDYDLANRIEISKKTFHNKILNFAAEIGNKQIVEGMIKLGANTLKGALELTASNGHIGIVRMLVQTNKIYDYEDAIDSARTNGHEDIENFLSGSM